MSMAYTPVSSLRPGFIDEQHLLRIRRPRRHDAATTGRQLAQLGRGGGRDRRSGFGVFVGCAVGKATTVGVTTDSTVVTATGTFAVQAASNINPMYAIRNTHYALRFILHPSAFIPIFVDTNPAATASDSYSTTARQISCRVDRRDTASGADLPGRVRSRVETRRPAPANPNRRR